MADRLLNFYRLRDGVDIDAFKTWSRTVDQPTCNSMEACHSFTVHMVTGERMGERAFDVVEDIVIESYEAWEEATKSEAFAQVNREWPLWGVEESVISLYCEQI
jgi:hypothetical protein